MGATNRLQLPYPEATDPPNGSSQIRQLAEAIDVTLNRSAEGLVTVPPFTNVASGVAIPGASPIRVTFTPGRFTVAPAVHCFAQGLPGGAPWVTGGVTNISKDGFDFYAYNTRGSLLSMASPLPFAWIALQSD